MNESVNVAIMINRRQLFMRQKRKVIWYQEAGEVQEQTRKQQKARSYFV